MTFWDGQIPTVRAILGTTIQQAYRRNLPTKGVVLINITNTITVHQLD